MYESQRMVVPIVFVEVLQDKSPILVHNPCIKANSGNIVHMAEDVFEISLQNRPPNGKPHDYDLRILIWNTQFAKVVHD